MVNSPDVEAGFDDQSDEGFEYPSRRRRRLTVNLVCKRCCRLERHVLVPSIHRVFPLTVLFTLGFVYWIGPFACTCCGQRRFFKFDLTSANKPRRWGRRYWFGGARGLRDWDRRRRGGCFRRLTRPFRRLFSSRRKR